MTFSCSATYTASVITRAVGLFVLFAGCASGQTPSAVRAETSTDLFVMFGSDLARPGLLPRANENIGLGHTFEFLKKNPLGDELTFSYTYENVGPRGFLHTDKGEHTETLGISRNFALPRIRRVTGYTSIQLGLSSFTGNPKLQNRFYDGEALGASIHLSRRSSIWIQELYNKMPGVPWYTTSSTGYTWSW